MPGSKTVWACCLMLCNVFNFWFFRNHPCAPDGLGWIYEKCLLVMLGCKPGDPRSQRADLDGRIGPAARPCEPFRSHRCRWFGHATHHWTCAGGSLNQDAQTTLINRTSKMPQQDTSYIVFFWIVLKWKPRVCRNYFYKWNSFRQPAGPAENSWRYQQKCDSYKDVFQKGFLSDICMWTFSIWVRSKLLNIGREYRIQTFLNTQSHNFASERRVIQNQGHCGIIIGHQSCSADSCDLSRLWIFIQYKNTCGHHGKSDNQDRSLMWQPWYAAFQVEEMKEDTEHNFESMRDTFRDELALYMEDQFCGRLPAVTLLLFLSSLWIGWHFLESSLCVQIHL